MPKTVDINERRAVLTEAASRLIARSGIEAATMRDVAAEAGLTTGALTHYFADKRDLLLHTFEASLERRRALRVTRESDPRDALRAALEGALPLDDDRRRHWMVTVAFCAHATGDDELATAQRDAYREFRQHVAHLVWLAHGVGRPSNGRVAERLIAAADGIAVQALFDPERWTPTRQRRTLADLTSALLPTNTVPE
jgi:AcrR family transcriptional regulator